MRLTYENIVRGILLVLFVFSSLFSILTKHPHHQAGLIAGLSISGLLILEACLRLQPKKEKDWQPELDKLVAKHDDLKEDFKRIRDDISIAKISSTIGRR